MFFLAFVVGVDPVDAQTPTGAIAGVVTDAAGSPVAEARIIITNRYSGLTRNLTSSSEGAYSASALPSGVYLVASEATGFQRLERTATVEAGTTTSVDLTLQVGEMDVKVTVNDAAPLLHYDHHQVGGVVSRNQIEQIPLNGPNFLELAKLEPGVTHPVRGTNNRTFVSLLGSGLQTSPRVGFTRVTVDGASILLLGGPGAALNVSRDVVQEFQLVTVNFDLSTIMTSNGAINIVTRAGGNQYHGSGFYYYRDHNLAAYPGLSRDSNTPDPFFQRRHFGYQISGPIRKDQVFFFTSYEHNNQLGVQSVQPRTNEFASLGGIFPSPFVGNQFNLRLDARLHANHNVFVRHTHDRNRAFSNLGGAVAGNLLPSAWSRITNWADQSQAALTSVLSSKLVNDLRFSYFFHSSPETPATASDCPGCFGLGAPRINIPDAGIAFGRSRKTSFIGRRYQLAESLIWQRSRHRVRVGFDWEHASWGGQLIMNDPATINLYSPEEVRRFNSTVPPPNQIALPTSFSSLDDILRLPLRNFTTNVGPGLEFIYRDFEKYYSADLYRFSAGDSWHVSPRFNVSYGLAWSYEPNSLNTDLTKPTLLLPILGPSLLAPPVAQKANFSATVGFAWSATADGMTVIRCGAGRYFDPVVFNGISITNERRALSPVGTGRRTIPGSAILHQGRPLNFVQNPTGFTGADLLAILAEKRSELARQFNTDNRDFTFRNLNLNKTGLNLSDPFYDTPYGLHLNLGVQRGLASDVVISADFAWRRFLHTFLPDIDYNRFDRRINDVQIPVIPRCTSDAQRNNLTAICSSGVITFDNTTGIADYKGLLLRLEKRFSRRTQFLVSYALGNYRGSNGTATGGGFNNDQWFENYGPMPTDLRHILNLSGVVDLPRRFQVAFNISTYSRPPLTAFLSGVDFNGDGTSSDLLPGTTVNQLNRGISVEELDRVLQRYNRDFAGRRTAGGQIAPSLTLPAKYSFNDNYFTQDLRVSRTFSFGGKRLRLSLFGEVFNLFNTANLLDYSGNIANPASFGQPTRRFDQVFGSGGPRAFQLGSRISF